MEWFWVGLLVICVTVARTDAQCHCSTTELCDKFPLTPCSQMGGQDMCQEGWFGMYCQKQNIALRRSCNQSSTLNGDANNYGARLGVDGRVTTDARSQPLTCAHTINETNPTWTVNLNTSFPEKIQHIRLYLCGDDLQNRSNGMEIPVGSQMCYNWSSTEHPPPIANVTCRQPITGTTVTIRIPGPLKCLGLCEVQIFACPDSYYGLACRVQCGKCVDGDVCIKTNGTCPGGCAAGWFSDRCDQPCQEGRYGANCPSPCGHCLDTDVCDKVTGKCPRGCQPGWWPDLCSQACSDGRHGHHCQSECGHCKENLPCNKINGTCNQGCQPGFEEPLCKECVDGMYGDYCMSRCGQCKDALTCDKSSGECPEGCQGNFMKPLCQGCTECPATSGYSNQVVPFTATLGILLVLALIALLTSIIYIRRLKIQLDASQKKPEDNYLSLDESTKDTVVENTYEHIAKTTE